jgi:tripeptide aminopeptidase
MTFNCGSAAMDLLTDKLVKRFIGYTGLNTSSDPKSGTFPSTPQQLKFAAILAGELTLLGLSEVEVDINGYVMATLPCNLTGDFPVVGLIAHYDTSPDFNGDQIKPMVIESYAGGKILLHEEKQLYLDPAEFPELSAYTGQSLITTDGTSLLGADDKAGIAEIVSAMEILLNSPEIKHGTIRICFTPDEEIGRGADRFDIGRFGADFAYTIDGSETGELEFENFNAAYATLHITGKSVHPGAAKGKMVNAILVAHHIISMLPQNQRPETTELYEGFFHIVEITGNVAETRLEFLIRDHDAGKFTQKKILIGDIVDRLNLEYGYPAIHLELRDQYYNMKEKIEPVMYVVELAKRAMIEAGVEPKVKAIRGGTDGARLSWMGLPCPNIFTGGLYFHGPYEFIPIPSMLKAVEVILNICRMVPELKIGYDQPV